MASTTVSAAEIENSAKAVGLPSDNRFSAWLLAAPAVLFIVVLFVYPLFEIVVISFTEPKVSLNNYYQFFSSKLYSRVSGQHDLVGLHGNRYLPHSRLPRCPTSSCDMAANSAHSCCLVVAMSFWTSFLVRTYAWLVILGNKGPATKFMHWVGVDPSPQILFNSFASNLGMVHILIPYMVMSIYVAMTKIDPNHLRAAASLGATPFQGFRTVFFPLSLPGVVNGCTLVFIICLGFYVTPVLLGGPRDQMIAGLIGEQIQELLGVGLRVGDGGHPAGDHDGAVGDLQRFVGLDKLWG